MHTNWWGQAKRAAANKNILATILYVLPTMAELFDFMPVRPALRTFVQCSFIVYSTPEVASDEISDMFVRQIVLVNPK